MLLMIQVAVIVDIKDPFKGDNENEADRIISIYKKKKKLDSMFCWCVGR